MAIKFIDLFSGIGGIRLGLESAGFECVFSSDIDEECCKIYEANFGEKPHGDITKINAKDIPDHDILCAGFPCQPFSISGKQKGFTDIRGSLFFEICRIAEEKQPKVVLLENVKHLKYHDHGNTLKVIIKSLENLGYTVSWKILNAVDFNIPQNRERIIIIGTRDEDAFDFSKIQPKRNESLKSILQSKGDFTYLKPEEYTLIDNPKKQKSGLIFVGYRNKAIRKAGVRPGTEHLSRVHKQPNRIYSADGVHPTLASQETSGRYWILVDNKVRKLTLEECWKLMGFPEDFKKLSSTSEQYKQIGNSVVVPMFEEIAKEIKNQIF